MRRVVEVTLSRRWPWPFRRRVQVKSLTLARFIELMDVGYSGVFTDLLRKGAQPTQAAVLHALIDQPDLVCSLVEIVCPDEPPGFYRRWRSPANNGRIFDAACATNDWPLIGSVVKPGATAAPDVSLEGGLVLMCEHFPGLTPGAVYDMFVDHVIRTADGLRQVAARRNDEGPTAGLPVTDLESLGKMPGVQVLH